MNRKKWLIATLIAFTTITSSGFVQAEESATTDGSVTPEVNTSSPEQITPPVEEVVKPARIMVSVDSVRLKKKEERKISVSKTYPESQFDLDIKWESSNEKIATVDQSGLVKAVGSGKAKIRATLSSNPEVFDEVPVFVDGITVSYHGTYSPVLNIGDEIILLEAGTGSYYDPKDVVWKASNPKVVSLKSDGDGSAEIKAISQGSTEITVQYPTGEIDSIWVTVKAPVLAKTVKLNIHAATVRKGNQLNLKATVGDKNTTDKTVRWYSSNKKFATVDSKGKVTAKSAGTATITAKTTNNKIAKVTIRIPYEKSLKSGDWTVGKSLPAGRYEILTESESGILRVYRKSKRIVNVKIGMSQKGSTVYSYTTTFKSGDKIKVSKMQKATFVKK